MHLDVHHIIITEYSFFFWLEHLQELLKSHLVNDGVC